MKTNNWTARQILVKLWNRVDEAPEGEQEGGGGQGQSQEGSGKAGSDGEETLRDEGKKALEREREARRQLERQLADLRATHPEAVEEARRRAEEAEQRLREREQLSAAERERLERKHQDSLQRANSVADEERNKRIRLEIRGDARAAFDAAEGRDGADDQGRTFFDAFMALVGEKHLRRDEATGQTFVVDAQGDKVMAADGSGPIKLSDWINLQADNSPVIGALFKPKGGQGSGGFVGTRGYRATQARDPQQVSKMTANQFLQEAYPD